MVSSPNKATITNHNFVGRGQHDQDLDLIPECGAMDAPTNHTLKEYHDKEEENKHEKGAGAFIDFHGVEETPGLPLKAREESKPATRYNIQQLMALRSSALPAHIALEGAKNLDLLPQKNSTRTAVRQGETSSSQDWGVSECGKHKVERSKEEEAWERTLQDRFRPEAEKTSKSLEEVAPAWNAWVKNNTENFAPSGCASPALGISSGAGAANNDNVQVQGARAAPISEPTNISPTSPETVTDNAVSEELTEDIIITVRIVRSPKGSVKSTKLLTDQGTVISSVQGATAEELERLLSVNSRLQLNTSSDYKGGSSTGSLQGRPARTPSQGISPKPCESNNGKPSSITTTKVKARFGTENQRLVPTNVSGSERRPVSLHSRAGSHIRHGSDLANNIASQASETSEQRDSIRKKPKEGEPGYVMW